MFNLINFDKVMYWRRLFAILSLEESAPYLKPIGFPLAAYTAEFRDLCLAVLRRLIEVMPYISRGDGHLLPVVELFVNTFQQLKQTIGEADTRRLRDWGDVLSDEQLKNSVITAVSLLPKGSEQREESNQSPLLLPPETLAWIVQPVEKLVEASLDIVDVRINARRLTENARGRDVIALFNEGIHYNDGKVSEEPFVYQYGFFGLIHFPWLCLFRAIQQHLSAEELAILTTWMTTHPKWPLEDPDCYTPAQMFARLRVLEGTSLDKMCADYIAAE